MHNRYLKNVKNETTQYVHFHIVYVGVTEFLRKHLPEIFH